MTIYQAVSQAVGWQWQPPLVGGFIFFVNGGKAQSWPQDQQPGIAPRVGDFDTLDATSKCQPQPQPHAVLLTDTLCDQYTFVLQVQ